MDDLFKHALAIFGNVGNSIAQYAQRFNQVPQGAPTPPLQGAPMSTMTYGPDIVQQAQNAVLYNPQQGIAPMGMKNPMEPETLNRIQTHSLTPEDISKALSFAGMTGSVGGNFNKITNIPKTLPPVLNDFDTAAKILQKGEGSLEDTMAAHKTIMSEAQRQMTPQELAKTTNMNDIIKLTEQRMANEGAPSAQGSLPKYNSAMDALNDSEYLSKLKAAQTNRVSGGNKIVKVSPKELIPSQELSSFKTDDISLTKGPIHAVNTPNGPLVLDGNHRLNNALKANAKNIDTIFLTPEEAISRYKNEIPNLKNLIENPQVTQGSFYDVAKQTEKKAFDYYNSNKENLTQEYIRQNGNVVNPDNAKELFKPVGYNYINAKDFHEPSSQLAKRVFKQLLEEKKGTGNNEVLFTAGGSGVGKTTAIKDIIGNRLNDYSIIYDSNFSNLKSAETKINQALDNGYKPEITYVYRDPVQAWNEGVLKRTARGERHVPIDIHIDLHDNSKNVIQAINDKYGNKVNITVIDNSGPKGQPQIVPIDFLDKVSYNKDNLRRQIYESTNQAIQSGKISASKIPELQKIQNRIKISGSAPQGFPQRLNSSVPQPNIAQLPQAQGSLKDVAGDTVTLYRASPNLPNKGNFKQGTYFADSAEKARYYSESHLQPGQQPQDIKIQQFTLPKDAVFKEPSTGNYTVKSDVPVNVAQLPLSDVNK